MNNKLTLLGIFSGLVFVAILYPTTLWDMVIFDWSFEKCGTLWIVALIVPMVAALGSTGVCCGVCAMFIYMVQDNLSKTERSKSKGSENEKELEGHDYHQLNDLNS